MTMPLTPTQATPATQDQAARLAMIDDILSTAFRGLDTPPPADLIALAEWILDGSFRLAVELETQKAVLYSSYTNANIASGMYTQDADDAGYSRRPEVHELDTTPDSVVERHPMLGALLAAGLSLALTAVIIGAWNRWTGR